jgi:hypothetical protein
MFAVKLFLAERAAGRFCICGCHAKQHRDETGACNGHWCDGTCSRFTAQ